MNEDWGRLATEIKAARATLAMTQKDLARAAGVGPASIQRLESGAGYDDIPPSAYKIATVFGWTAESLRAILAGRTSVPAERREPAPAPQRGLPARVEQALTDGDLVDTEVLELPGGLTVVVVARQDETRSAEEQADLADALREWTRARRKLKDITGEA
jgi:DNA-binding XRE family transcriptional regulator